MTQQPSSAVPSSRLALTSGFPWWLPLLAALIAGIGAFVLTERVGAVYRARVYMVTPQDGAPPEEYAGLLTNPAVLTATIDTLRLNATPAELGEATDVAISGTLITVGVRATDATGAQLLAHTLVSIAVGESGELLQGQPPPMELRPPSTPTDTVGRHTGRNSTLAMLGGLLGGLALALVIAGPERARLRPLNALAGVGWNTLALVADRGPQPVLPGRGPNDEEGPALIAPSPYDRLLEAVGRARGAVTGTVLIVDLHEGAGAARIATGLAGAAAARGIPTFLVDADLRGPSIHRHLEIANDAGLGDALREPEQAPLTIPVRSRGNLRVVTAGALPPEPAPLFAGARMGAVLRQLQQAAPSVFFTGTPLERFDDAATLAARMDDALIVVDRGRLERGSLRRVGAVLSATGARVAGAIITEAEAEDFEAFEEWDEQEPMETPPVTAAPAPQAAPEVAAESPGRADFMEDAETDSSEAPRDDSPGEPGDDWRRP